MNPNLVTLTNRVSIPGKRYYLKTLFMWGLAATFYFYDYLLQVSPSAMKPELMLSFVKDAEDFGSLSAYCLYAYGLMQIPAGMLLDRFGPRRIITIACILCAMGSLTFGDATTLWQAKIGRFLIGAGAGFALLACLKIATHWFPKNRFAMMTGLTATVGFLGAAFGLACVADIVALLGWRESLFWGGIIGLILSVFLWLVIKDKKIEVVLKPSEQTMQSALSGLVYVLKNKQTWIAALFAGFMFVPTLAFGGLWGIPFLVEAHGLDRDTAGKCASLIYVGWVFGGAFWGCLSDYLGQRNKPMIIATLMTLIITISLIYSSSLSLPLMKGLLLGLGFFSSAFIVAFAVITETNPPQFAATANGFANALNTLWGALAQPFIGLILDINSKAPVYKGGERIFSFIEYQQAFMALPICLIISFCFLLFLRETSQTTR
jgi:sugar phosphate permease